MLEAQVEFIKTIVIPIVLLLVVTASVFYDAYQNLGDNDTAHSLAYGLVYSWLIILAVAGNCFTSSASDGILERTIGEILPLSDTTVRLSERYVNALRWRFWLLKIGVVSGFEPKPTTSGKFRFLAGQLFGWVCVAIAASCAAAISWTTPTVGIGCRSFNFLLYALVSLAIALIPPIVYWKEGVGSRQTFGTAMNWTRRALMFCNMVILVGGTLFHLTGLFRSCMCMNLFVSDSRILELNSNTQQAVNNANAYWLSVGYMAFIFIWLVCAASIVMRQYISVHVEFLRRLNVGEDEYGVRRTAFVAYETQFLAAYAAAQRRLNTMQEKIKSPFARRSSVIPEKHADHVKGGEDDEHPRPASKRRSLLEVDRRGTSSRPATPRSAGEKKAETEVREEEVAPDNEAARLLVQRGDPNLDTIEEETKK